MNDIAMEKHLDWSNELEILGHIKQTTRLLIKYKKQKDKAVEREFENGWMWSRANNTTCVANSYKLTQLCNWIKEELIFMVNYLNNKYI